MDIGVFKNQGHLIQLIRDWRGCNEGIYSKRDETAESESVHV